MCVTETVSEGKTSLVKAAREGGREAGREGVMDDGDKNASCVVVAHREGPGADPLAGHRKLFAFAVVTMRPRVAVGLVLLLLLLLADGTTCLDFGEDARCSRSGVRVCLAGRQALGSSSLHRRLSPFI